MTTIDIQVKMNGRDPNAFRVRIVRDENSDDGELLSGHSPNMSTRSAVRRVNRERSAGDLTKSPARRLKSQPHSFDISSEMLYSGDQFTIIAHLPNEEMEGEKQTRLKIPCSPGMTVQQVIEKELPYLSNTSYLVYQFPSKALLNTSRDASVLQGQEIWIEPTRADSAEETTDQRLSVVRDFYRTEDAYLEHLKNIFDVYMEPLRTWGISQTDMNTLFLSLSRLCDLLMNFFSELELAVKSWNTHSTLIGGIFKQYHTFWDMYVEYAQNYTVAMNLLKKKRTDESFNKFLEIKRGAAMHTLESLMLLPVQRVSDYNRYLSQLLTLTSREHRDYQNIRLTLARTEEIIQARADELVYLQNESKLDQVQHQFPHDHLYLLETFSVTDTSVQKKKSTVQTPTGMYKQIGSTQPQKHSKGNPLSDSENTDGLGSRRNLRMYIQEGPVKLIVLNKPVERERYLFLFSNLLLIAKPTKAGRTNQHRCYKLKNQLRLGEMWIAECNNEHSPGHRRDCSFIVGWPLDNCIAMNCIAVFSTEALKSLWFGLFSKNIQMQRKLCLSDSISIRISNTTKCTSSNIPEFTQVHVADTVVDLIEKAINIFEIKEPAESFQLWMKLSKDEKEDILNGFESPFAIQDHHNRVQMDLSSGDIRPQQLEFVLKRKLPQSVGGHSSRSSTSIFHFKKRRPKPSRFSNKREKRVKMFSVPLELLIINNQLPEKLQEVLVRLWVDAPTTFGIFRQSPSVKKIREMREGIDGCEPVDMSDVSLHVLGALLKDFLRNVPGGIIPSARYTEFVATNDIKEFDLRIQKIRGILIKLPVPNQIFLKYLLPLLNHISLHEDENGMSSTNLAICFAPSLLEPDYSLSVIKNEAPTLVDFMIKHAPEIYNGEVPELFKQFDLPADSDREIRFVPVKDEDDTEMSEDFYPSHKRNMSMDTCTSASEDSLDEDEMHVSLLHTTSDSKVSDRSILSGSSVRGRITLLSDRSEEVSTGIEGDQSDVDEDEEEDRFSTKRLRHDVGHSKFGQVGLGSGEVGGRRRTIGTQSIPNQYMHHFSQELHGSPAASPRSTRTAACTHVSLSQGYPSHVPSHLIDPTDSDATGVSGNRSEPSSTRQTHKKKRRKPGHSNSFSKTSDLMHNEARIPQSSSTSFGYDSLSPSDRPRSRSVAIAAAMGRTPHEEFLTQSLEHAVIHNSNQSISSRTSGSSTGSQTQSRGTQTRPQLSSVTSLLSNRSGGSGSHRSSSPDPSLQATQTPKKADDVKVAISKRFGLAPKPLTSSPMYDSDVSQDTLIPAEEEFESPKVPGVSPIDYSYQKDTSQLYRREHTQPNPRGSIKRFESTETTSSIDDRPEAERHFNGGSLTRVTPDDYKQSLTSGGSLGRKGPFSDLPSLGTNSTPENGSRLTIISGGYNSDTESSPSRTLSRQEKKLQEVSSPQTSRSALPLRYSRQFDGSVNASEPLESKSSDALQTRATDRESLHERRNRSSTVSYGTYVSQHEVKDLPHERRGRSSTVGHGVNASQVEDREKSSPSAKNTKRFTYEAYQKRYESSKSGITTVNENEISNSVSAEDGRKTLTASLDHYSETRKIREDRSISPGIGSKVLSVTSRDFSAKSRSMPDYAKRSVARTLTTTPAIKTVKVVRYELPTPKKIRRINLRAYNSNK